MFHSDIVKPRSLAPLHSVAESGSLDARDTKSVLPGFWPRKNLFCWVAWGACGARNVDIYSEVDSLLWLRGLIMMLKVKIIIDIAISFGGGGGSSGSPVAITNTNANTATNRNLWLNN